jgi:hypothetical protein
MTERPGRDGPDLDRVREALREEEEEMEEATESSDDEEDDEPESR